MVRAIGLEPFFAEGVQDLNGLDTNILNALRDCVAFITVLHPRGAITRLDNSIQIRASIWIEQEIAVATYIQRVEKRDLPIIAFKHESVGREGIRDLLNLNPIEFTKECEVLAALPGLLEPWKSLATSDIRLQLDSNYFRVSRVRKTLLAVETSATTVPSLRVQAAVLLSSRLCALATFPNSTAFAEWPSCLCWFTTTLT